MKRNAPSLLIFITFAYVGGILLSPLAETLLRYTLIPAVVLSFLCYFLSRKSFSSLPQHLFSLGLMLAFVAIGSLSYQASIQIPAQDLSHFTQQELSIEGEVISGSRSTPYGHKAIIKSLDSRASGNFILYLNDQQAQVGSGDRIACQIKVKELKSQYPSYLEYLHRKDIYAAASCKSLNLKGKASGPFALMAQWREGLSQQIFKSMPDEQMAGIAVAMLLGDRSQLDPELRETFSQAGLAHILAISGMHVGLIFLFLKSLLAFLLPGARFVKSRKLAVLLILVAYAFLTGCSPAVCRAVFMFGLLILAEVFHLQKSRFHILASSALFLLVVDPRMIFDPGFQLSYAAVAGIMIAATPLRDRILERFSSVPRTLATLLSVSLCAQAFTAPLIILHFGEFPTYFLLSNLILLPLAAWTVRLGFVSLFMLAVPGLNEVMFRVLDLLLWLLVEGTQFISNLPAAVTRSISFSDPGFLILCAMSLLLAALLYRDIFIRPVYELKRLISNA